MLVILETLKILSNHSKKKKIAQFHNHTLQISTLISSTCCTPKLG